MNILTLYNHMSKIQEGHRPSTELEGIKQPLKVRVLILSESRLSLKQFYLIRQFSQVLKLDLSHNKIASFPVGFGLSNFPQIRTLFLHHNRFSVLRNLAPVAQSSSLQYLTLFGNPLEETKARHLLVNQIPSLLLMDDKIILLEERHQDFALPSIQSPQLNFPLVPFTSSNQSQDYLVTLLYQLHLLRKVFLKANPVIAIQRWWRRLMKIKHPTISSQPQRMNTELLLPLKKQNSLQQYRSDLSRLHAQKVIVKKSKDKLVLSFMQSNKVFWGILSQIFRRGDIYLSRQFCMIRSIPFEQINQWIFIRHSQRLHPQKLSQKRGLLFFLSIHNSLVIRKNYKHVQKKPIQLTNHLCEKYNIIKTRFLSIQQKLIKKDQTYHHYVIPSLTKDQLMTIVKKEYFKAQRTLLSGSRISDFPVLVQNIALRGRAAVSIQRFWRGFKARQNVNAYEQRRRKNSAIKIQRWVKNLGFYHRYRFLVEVSHYLKNQRDNQIILPMTSIEAIKSYSDYKQRYGHNFVIPFQKNQFSVSKTASMLTNIVFFAHRNPYPQFLDLTFKSQQLANNNKSEVLQLLFKGAKSINTIIDSKNLAMVRISYDSVDETRSRKFMLALKTYRMVNHQFIRSKSGQTYQITADLIKQVNSNRMITMMYNQVQPQNKDSITSSLHKGLKTDKSQSSLQSQAYILDEKIYLKIRYFNVKTDLSCTLLLSYPHYNPIRQQSKPQGMGRYYLGKRSLSKRYQSPNEINQSFSKISRNIINFQAKQSQKKSFNKILNTDQSHSIIQSLSNQGSAPRFQSYRRMESHDRFDRQVYPPTENLHNEMKHQQQLLLKQKRQKIQQAKTNHRKNVSYLANLRKNSLQSLRQSLHKQDQEANKVILEARNALEQQKARKHERIRQHFQSQSTSFQKEFLQKGIKNIRLNFHRLEKTVTIRQKHSPQRSLLQPLKTQFKQFSINFEDGEGQEYDTQNRSRKKQKLRDALKKQIQDYASRQKTQKSSITPPQTIVNYRQPQKQIKVQKDKQAQKEKKKLRKKRLVHSVFPQQFYPLKQSQQIGFQLPKIVKK